MKRIYLSFLIIIIPCMLHSQWDNNSQLEGSGTEEDPYQITTLEELQNADYESNYNELVYFKLMNNIDATETRNWNVGDHDKDQDTPDKAAGFIPLWCGTVHFDGNGKIIKNLYINRPKVVYVGLFSWTGTRVEIKKLGLMNCDVTGQSTVGSLIGHFDGYGNVVECFSTGKVQISGRDGAGGMCGNNKSIEFKNCYTTCDVYALDSDHEFAAGAFQVAYHTQIRHEGCYAAGKVVTPGGKVVFNKEEIAPNCYWDIETTGIPPLPDSVYNIPGDNRYCAVGRTTAEMMQDSTFRGWDFENIWYIDNGNDYPRLRAFMNNPWVSVETTAPEISMNISPNPAYGRANIRYTLPEPGAVSIILYNSLGTKIKTITETGYMPDGSHNAGLNTGVLPPGVYFISLKSRAFSKTEKIVVMR